MFGDGISNPLAKQTNVFTIQAKNQLGTFQSIQCKKMLSVSRFYCTGIDRTVGGDCFKVHLRQDDKDDPTGRTIKVPQAETNMKIIDRQNGMALYYICVKIALK